MPVTFSVDANPSPEAAPLASPATPERNTEHWRRLHEAGAYFAKHPRYQDRLNDLGVERCRRHLHLSSTDTLLEIGCGYGRLLWHLRPLVNRVIGVDLAEPPIAEARELMRRRGGGTFHVVAGTSLDVLDDASVDACAVFNVFQHMTREGVAAYLREIRRVLKPGGRLAAQFLTGDDSEQAMDVPGEQSLGYSAGAVARLMERSGLDVQLVEREWLTDMYPEGRYSWWWVEALAPSEWRVD